MISDKSKHLWAFDTPAVDTDLDIVSNTIENAINVFRKTNPTAFIRSIKLLREDVKI